MMPHAPGGSMLLPWLGPLCHAAAGLALLWTMGRRRAGAERRPRAWTGALAASVFVIAGLLPSGLVLARLPSLLGTGYALLLGAKLLLTALPVTLWASGRRPALLAAAVAASCCLALAAPVAAAQPVWPFGWTLTLEGIRVDPVSRLEVLRALPWLAVATALLLGAPLLPRRLRWTRWLLPAAGLLMLWLRAPDLEPLVAPAYPTSYYRSTTGFTADAILSGEAIYRARCTACHGAGARGDGVLAGGLSRAPADLTASHLWMHTDGELFWWLWNGITAADGTPVMPAYRDTLAAADIWHAIDYIRSRNAGAGLAMRGRWSPTVLAPDFPITCADPSKRRLSDLRGSPALIKLGAAAPSGVGTKTVVVTSDDRVLPTDAYCVSAAYVAQAFVIVAGLSARDKTQGTTFLVDRNGWLRAVQLPGHTAGWDDPGMLAATLWQLEATPILGDTALCHAQD